MFQAFGRRERLQQYIKNERGMEQLDNDVWLPKTLWTAG